MCAALQCHRKGSRDGLALRRVKVVGCVTIYKNAHTCKYTRTHTHTHRHTIWHWVEIRNNVLTICVSGRQFTIIENNRPDFIPTTTRPRDTPIQVGISISSSLTLAHTYIYSQLIFLFGSVFFPAALEKLTVSSSREPSSNRNSDYSYN